MAVQEQTPYIEHIANGVTTSFSLGFVCDSADKLVVTVNDIPTNVGDWSFSDENVVFQYPPLSDSTIKIWRNSPLARSTTFKTYDNSLNPNSLNLDLDKIWLVMQELNVKNFISDNKLQELLDKLVDGDINGLPAEVLARIAGDESIKSLVNLEAIRAHQAESNLSIRIDNESLLANQNILAEKQRAEAAEQGLQIQINSVGVGNKAYKTYALMDADKTNIPAKSKVTVTNDATASNNGDWQWDGVAFTKSAYDPLTQAKADATAKANASEANANNYANQIATPTKAYKKINGTVEVIRDASDELRVVSSTTSGEFVQYGSAQQKELIAGMGITILETPISYTIEAGETVYEAPNEFVLCLIAGQSNATYYGGDAASSTPVPNNVCYVWDNTANVLRELNDGSITSIECKQSYGAALALEFYKQTGMGLIIVNSARGSTSQSALADSGWGNWDTTGTLRQQAIDRVNACKTYLNSNNWCYQTGFICWTQGERDGQAIGEGLMTVADYKSALLTMIDFFKTNLGLKIPFIMTTTAYYTSTGDNAATKGVRSAQMEVGHEKEGAYIGFTGAVKFPARGLMSDSVHYNQEGKNIIGKQLGKITSILSAGVN